MEEERTAVSADEEAGSEKEVDEKEAGSAEGETEEKDESATSDEEKREASDEKTDAEEDEEPPTKKKEGGFQRTIRKTKAQLTAEREARERVESENAYLRQQLRERQPVQPEAAAEAKPKPDPKDFINEETGELDQVAFTEAMSGYKAEEILAKREAKQREEEQQAEMEEGRRELQKRQKAFAEAGGIEDYEEAANVSAGVLRQAGQTPTTIAIADVVFEDEQGPALHYYLGNNPEELERIIEMSPHRAVMALGKIATQLASTEGKGDLEARTPTVTRAPKPPAPVKKAAGAGRKLRPDDPETAGKMTTQEWRKAREKQLRDRA